MAITTNNLISRQTVGSNGAASITFSNIPTTFTDLKIVMSIKSPTTSAAYEVLGINFTTSTSYSARHLEYWFATALTGTNTTFTKNGTTYGRVFDTGFNTLSSTYVNPSIYSSIEIYVPNYRSANYKSYSAEMASENNSASDGAFLEMTAGLSSDTAAISAITLAGRDNDFMEYSTFSLYGISSSTSTQNTSVPSATGGDVITTDGTYWYHAFKYSGTFTPLKALTADCLVVAGGGGSGYAYGAGGGAGGLLYNATTAFASGTAHTMTIGAGGNNGTNASRAGVVGNNSTITATGFTTLTANGGGGGGYNGTQNGGNGGSGGGASVGGSNNQSGGTATSGQGNAGGAGTSGNTGGSGGGGASAVGAAVVGNQTGGNGGVGSSAYSSWGSATLTGELVSSTRYYAGGGGGSSGDGGSGGGGWGANYAGTATIPNTGGGGGGDKGSGGGGSGIVIVRYTV